jgi:hypothetical protein
LNCSNITRGASFHQCYLCDSLCLNAYRIRQLALKSSMYVCTYFFFDKMLNSMGSSNKFCSRITLCLEPRILYFDLKPTSLVK